MPKSDLLIQREEHDEDLLAKKVSMVSGTTIYAVVNTAAAGAGNTTVEQGTTPWVTAQQGNITVDSIANAWPDPKGYIGLVTITGSLAPAAGNVTLDPGSATHIVDASGDDVNWADTGNDAMRVNVVAGGAGTTTVFQGGDWGLTGNVTIDSQPAWADPNTYIGLVTVDIGASNTVNAAFSGNVTLDPGSQTAITGNVTVEVGTGATDLGKAEDSAHASGDTGVAVLGKYISTDDNGIDVDTDNDYAVPHIDARGRLRVSPGSLHIIDNFSATTGWTVLNDDAGNIATDLNHVLGANSLEFDKLDGSSNTTDAIIQKTVTSFNAFNLVTGAVFIQGFVNIPDVTNVVNYIVRLGTDSSNYNEWRVDATGATAGQWEVFRTLLAKSTGFAGNGVDLTAITYAAVGVEFSDQSNTLTDILWDGLLLNSGQLHDVDISAEELANVRLAGYKTTNVDTGSGVLSNKTLRVVLPTDQPIVETSNTGNITIDSIGSNVNTVNIGNITIDSGTVTLGANDGTDIGNVDVASNTAWSDPGTYIGLVTITGSLAPAAGNVTLDPGSQTGITGNITIDSQPAWSDPNTYIGLVTVDIGASNTVDASFSGNVTLDSGSLTGIIGNVTVDQVDVVTAVTDITNPVALKGNLTIDSGSIGVTSNTAWANPNTYIGLVTVDIGDSNTVSASFAGNVTLDPGSITQITGNITVDQVDVVTTVTAVTDITNPVALKGNLTLSDAKTYIGLTTSTIGNVVTVDMAGNNDVTITGNVTIEDGGESITIDGNVGLVAGAFAGAGNVTVDLVDTVTTVTAVTDITNPVAITGNLTIDQVDVVTAVTSITNPVAITGNITLENPQTYIGLVTATSALVSPFTAFATVVSASPATIIVPPSGDRIFVKDVHVAAQGGAEVSLWSANGSASTARIPPTSLATQGGFVHNFGDLGMRWGEANDAFTVSLAGTTTVAIMANVRFE